MKINSVYIYIKNHHQTVRILIYINKRTECIFKKGNKEQNDTH